MLSNIGSDDYARAQREREKFLPLQSGMDLTLVQCQELERAFKEAWDAHGDGGDRPASTRIWYSAVLSLLTQYGYEVKLLKEKEDLTKVSGC